MTGKVFEYIEGLPGSAIYIVFNNCNSQDGKFVNLSKGCLTSSTEINICSLNYVLPNPSTSSEFLTTNKIKFYLFSLLPDIITSEHLVTDKRFFVTKGKFCYINQTKVLY